MALQQLRKALPFGTAQKCMSTLVAGDSALTLPELPYEYSALEPCISGQIMELHHKKHHNAYLTNYNKALEQWQEAESKQDSNALPKISSALHFNGGGTPVATPSVCAPLHATRDTAAVAVPVV
jgi:Fe-Mn family superoxide dismutase